MSNVLELARRKYQAEGIDSLLVDFLDLPVEKIQHYIAKVHEDLEQKRAHLKPVQ